MIDIETQKPISVHVEGDAGPYLMVPLPQLHDVQRVLEMHEIAFTVSRDAIQLDGKPFIAIIDFDRATDTARIQAVLDAA